MNIHESRPRDVAAWNFGAADFARLPVLVQASVRMRRPKKLPGPILVVRGQSMPQAAAKGKFKGSLAGDKGGGPHLQTSPGHRCSPSRC